MPGTSSSMRQTSSEVNRYPNRPRGVGPVSADGAICPIIYGREETEGYKFAEVKSGSYLYVGMIWCAGPINKVEAVYINDADVDTISGVSVRHYLGLPNQTPDTWLESVHTDYTDDLIFNLPGGSVPVAYSVFRINTGAIDGAPRFRAIIQGKIINDPDAGSNTDPYFSDVAAYFDFQTGGVDQSNNSHPRTLHGDATIDSGGLQLTGVEGVSPTLGPAYMTVKGDSTLDFLSQEFCEEWVITSTNAGSSPEVLETIFNATVSGSPLTKIARLDLSGSSLIFYLSSDGSTWDIVNGETITTLTTSKTYLTFERFGNQLTAFKNGVEVWTKELLAGSPLTAQSIYQDTSSPTSTWYVGSLEGSSNFFVGSIQGWRRTIGVYRYGSDHVATATPFADSDTYSAGDVYSENPALYWADFATNTVYGLGATVTGVSEAAAWCNEVLETGEKRAYGVGLTLAGLSRAEDWLDLMATYSQCFWFPEGSTLRIQPDRDITSDNPSGLEELVTDGGFDGQSPQAWTIGAGWIISAGLAIRFAPSPNADSSISQTITTEAGVEYAISYDISTTGSPESGGVKAYFDGVLIIPQQSSVGTYTGIGKASGTSTTIELVAVSGTPTISLDNVSVKRRFHLEEKFLSRSLRFAGVSERETPNSCKTSFTNPTDDGTPWGDDAVVLTTPDAEDGTSPFIQTSLSLPGLRLEDQAKNQNVLKLQRVYRRMTSAYVTADHGILHRRGDVIQVRNTNRGVDKKILVEDTEMTSLGRWRVKGQRYGVSVPDPRFLSPNVEFPYQYSNSVTLDIDPKRVLLAYVNNETADEVDFTSIPQTYNRLIIQGFLRASIGADVEPIQIYFNEDTTAANYHAQEYRGVNGSVGPQEFPSPRVSYCPATSSPSGSYGSVYIVIENYTSSFRKIAGARFGNYKDVTGSPQDKEVNTGMFSVLSSVSSAITRIRLRGETSPTDTLIGSVRLYGEY